MKTSRLKSSAVAALVLALILAAGCASRQDVQTLDQRNRQTMQEARELFKQLEEQIAIAREEARKSSAPVQAKQADIWAEVEGLKTEVAAMKGQLDTLNMRVGSQGSQEVADLNERLKAVELALETQFAVDLGKGAKAAAAAPSPAPAQAANQPAQAEAAAPQDPADALYAKGLNAFKERKYDEARRDFAEFTTTFKKHALVPNAVFWQGECYYQMGDYAKAVLAYQDVIDKYKDSPKYRSAMLKQGISFYKLGKDKPGKIILQELIDKNPGTAEANRAKQFLADPKK
jgi:tol-pal system protein YbgF